MKNIWTRIRASDEGLLIPQATKKGYILCPPGGAFDVSYPTSVNRRGRVQEGGVVSPTITTVGAENIFILKDMETKQSKDRRPEGKGWLWDEEASIWFRVRKLTPVECFRLMGVKEDFIYLIQTRGEDNKFLISKSQQYKLAGNSIVVDVLTEIFENMFYPEEEVTDGMEGMIQLQLF